MTNAALCRLGWLLALALGACTASPPKSEAPGKVTAQLRPGSAELRTYQVMDWVAPDDRTLVVNGVDRSLFEARFRGGCTGLRLANTIAFIIPPGAQLASYSGVVLPDGTHCPFRSFTALVRPPAAANASSTSQGP